MNIVFFGSDKFGVPALRSLLESREQISCVVTQPDRKGGRGLHLKSTEIKELASSNHLRVYQPADINSSDSFNYLKKLDADLFIVVAYGQILSSDILKLPKIFALNIHASLLPKYRGASPINRAVINGDKSTGVTIMKLLRAMDAGPIMAQDKTDIFEDESSPELEERLSKMGAKLLMDALKKISTKNYTLKDQDAEKVTYAQKLKKEDGLIVWDKSALEIKNLIRGSLPWPGAFTYYKGKMLKIFRAKVSFQLSAFSFQPGKIVSVSKDGIAVAARKDIVIIEKLQIEGKRVMSAQEFIAGHKIAAGDTFDKKGIGQ